MANPQLTETLLGGGLNLRGQKFGMLSVTRLWPRRHNRKRMWVCKCDCGEEVVVRHDYLLHTNNPKTHCGCVNRGLPTLYSQEYHIHNSMLRRCYVENHVGYPAYGGRGIRVCDAWKDKEKGFEVFFKDMGPRPSKKHSLDRIDSNGNYVPGNVRWATLKDQARNKRNSVYLPHPQHGGLVPAAEVAEFLGIRYQSMRARYIKDGKWPGSDKEGVT